MSCYHQVALHSISLIHSQPLYPHSQPLYYPRHVANSQDQEGPLSGEHDGDGSASSEWQQISEHLSSTHQVSSRFVFVTFLILKKHPLLLSPLLTGLSEVEQFALGHRI